MSEHARQREIVDALVKENTELKKGLEEAAQACRDYVSSAAVLVERNAKLETVARAAAVALGWIEPVMDGFRIPSEAESRAVVLEPLKKALSALKDPP